MRHLAYLAVLLSVCAAAAARDNSNSQSNVLNSEFRSSLDSETNIKLTEQEKTLARQWMLTDMDWLKYRQVMSGPRGVWSPGLDPITALGVSETDPEERKRYAELWIKVETRRAEMELAFEVERQRAAKRILADQPVVQNASWIKQWEQEQVAINQRVMLFIDVGCVDECKSVFNDVRQSVGDRAQLDIFFSGGATADDIGQWASTMKIAPETVRARKITLNYDDGKARELDIDVTALPQVRVLDIDSGKITATYN